MANGKWRDQWSLDPNITFLNHGSYGACPTVILEEQSELRSRIEREPVDFFARRYWGLIDDARGRVAEFLAADTDGLVFVPNATTGVNAVLRSLAFEDGDEIVLLDHAYNAVNNAARFVAERARGRLVTVTIPYPMNDLSAFDVLEARLMAAMTPRTRLVIIDHVTSPTGLIMPVERWVPRIQDRGVDVLVDGAHAPGMRPLDLDALGAAYYAGNGHKWLCAPKGVGFLFVRADRRDRIHPVTISHGYGDFRAAFDWTGTGDPTAALCLPSAIDLLGGWLGDWPTLRATLDYRVGEGQGAILDRLGLTPPAPQAATGHLAVIALPGRPVIGPSRQDVLHERLFESHQVEVPVIPWPDPPLRLVRISAHLYNDATDYHRLADALVQELADEP